MNWADWAIIIILALSSLISLTRGFIKEAFSLVIWIVALVIANLYSHHLEQLLVNSIATPSVRAMAAFAGVFIGVLIVGALINFLIGLLVKATGLSGTDRLLGVCFGLIRGLFIVIVLLVYVPSFIPIKKDPWYHQSALIPYFVPYETTVKNIISSVSGWVGQITTDAKDLKATKSTPV